MEPNTKPTSWRRVTCGVLGGAVLVLVLICGGFGWLVLETISGVEAQADYGDFVLDSADGGWTYGRLTLMDGFERSNLTEIYVEVHGRRSSLAELKEEDVAPGQKAVIHDRTEEHPYRYAKYSLYGNDTIEFRDGELTQFSIRIAPPFLKFAASPNGPYYELPMSKRTMFKVFGKPEKIERRRKFF